MFLVLAIVVQFYDIRPIQMSAAAAAAAVFVVVVAA
jgi:hypothetical protein